MDLMEMKSIGSLTHLDRLFNKDSGIIMSPIHLETLEIILYFLNIKNATTTHCITE